MFHLLDMKKEKRNKPGCSTRDLIETILAYTVLGLLALIIVAAIVLIIYCFVRYGNTPPDEVPAWVWWIMWRR